MTCGTYLETYFPDKFAYKKYDLRGGDPSIWTRVSLDAPVIEIHVFGLGDGQAELVGNAIADAVTG